MKQSELSHAYSIIASATVEHAPCRRVVGFSGGKDSLALAKFCFDHFDGFEALHVNTGIGIERTREYVRDTCRDNHWPLIEIHAKEDCGQDYVELVRRFGFPGPGGHQLMYSRLKERAIRKLIRDSKRHHKDRVMICTGLRKDESKRRMGYGSRVVNRVDAQLWCNPIYFWPRSTRDEYLSIYNMPINPVSKELGMSGECLCGAFAHKGEKELVRLVDPNTACYIDELEQMARDCGHDWGWEDRPPHSNQTSARETPHPFCVGCEKVDDYGEDARGV